MGVYKFSTPIYGVTLYERGIFGMLIEDAYYVGTSIHSFRSGEPAKIIGVKTFYRADVHPVVCFNIIYGDGKEDWCPVSDVENYTLLAENEVRAGYTKVSKK